MSYKILDHHPDALKVIKNKDSLESCQNQEEPKETG